MIENLSPELAVAIGAGVLALVAVAWVLARWGRAILRFLLLLTGLVVLGLAALAMTRQARGDTGGCEMNQVHNRRELKTRRQSLQLLTYLRLSECCVGLLMNFNVPALKDGVKRLVYGFKDSSASPRLRGF